MPKLLVLILTLINSDVQWVFKLVSKIQKLSQKLDNCKIQIQISYFLREKDVLKRRIELILATGVNVIFTSLGIDDVA
jgi:chaperonin GroEL (HSP60 family)